MSDTVILSREMTTEEKKRELEEYCRCASCLDCIFAGSPYTQDCPAWDEPGLIDGAYSYMRKRAHAERDMVNHPGHYESGKFECIDVMLETQGREAVMGFCICNAFKYLYRHNRKNGIEDVKKAVWYLNKFLELAEED